MEKIFKDSSRQKVANNGFSERVMEQIATIAPPSRTIYRAPTLIAAMTIAVTIIVLTMTIGLGTMNDRYELWTEKLTSSHYVYAEYDYDE